MAFRTPTSRRAGAGIRARPRLRSRRHSRWASHVRGWQVAGGLPIVARCAPRDFRKPNPGRLTAELTVQFLDTSGRILGKPAKPVLEYQQKTRSTPSTPGTSGPRSRRRHGVSDPRAQYLAADPAAIAGTVRCWAEAGADTIVLHPTSADQDPIAHIRFAAQQVRPLL